MSAHDPLERAREANTEPVPSSVQAVQQSLLALIDESQALRGDVHTAEQARRRANHINLGVLGVVIIFVLTLFGLGVQNNHLSRQVNETNRRMSGCTTPGGACYEQGRQRTNQAVGDVVRVSVYVAECSRLWPGESGPAYDAKLQMCVQQRLHPATAPPSAPPSPTPSR
jgi:hypothetical protein